MRIKVLIASLKTLSQPFGHKILGFDEAYFYTKILKIPKLEQMNPAAAASLQLMLTKIVDSLYVLVGNDIIQRADVISELLVANVEPNKELVEERAARQNTIHKIMASCVWLTNAKLAKQSIDSHSLYATQSALPLADWKRRKKIFSVRHNGIDYFADFQFDASGTPLPIIKKILSALGEMADSWSIAAWFVFPNQWINDPAGNTQAGVAPKDVLDQGAALVAAAQCRRGTLS